MYILVILITIALSNYKYLIIDISIGTWMILFGFHKMLMYFSISSVHWSHSTENYVCIHATHLFFNSRYFVMPSELLYCVLYKDSVTLLRLYWVCKEHNTFATFRQTTYAHYFWDLKRRQLFSNAGIAFIVYVAYVLRMVSVCITHILYARICG